LLHTDLPISITTYVESTRCIATPARAVVTGSIIALLVSINDAVAADRQGTVGFASVTIGSVAIITLLATIDNAIAACREGAVILAAITVRGISVVALLAEISDAIAACGKGAVILAAIAVRGVSVVALLAGIDLAVAARSLTQESSSIGRIAAVSYVVIFLIVYDSALGVVRYRGVCRTRGKRCGDTDGEGDELAECAHVLPEHVDRAGACCGRTNRQRRPDLGRRAA